MYAKTVTAVMGDCHEVDLYSLFYYNINETIPNSKFYLFHCREFNCRTKLINSIRINCYTPQVIVSEILTYVVFERTAWPDSKLFGILVNQVGMY